MIQRYPEPQGTEFNQYDREIFDVTRGGCRPSQRRIVHHGEKCEAVMDDLKCIAIPGTLAQSGQRKSCSTSPASVA
jgi:hypothetical protein